MFDITQRKLVKVMTSGTDPEQVAVSHDGTRVFVANEDAGQLTVIDTAGGKIVDTFKIGDEPEGVSGPPERHPRLRHVRGRRRDLTSSILRARKS